MDATRPGSPAEPSTIVAEGSYFRGDFISACPIVVYGRIEGDMRAPAVTVTNSGALHGKIEAQTISSSGSVAGVLEADAIELSGAIARDTIVRAQRLNLDVESTSGRIELAFHQAVTVKNSKFPPASK